MWVLESSWIVVLKLHRSEQGGDLRVQGRLVRLLQMCAREVQQRWSRGKCECLR